MYFRNAVVGVIAFAAIAAARDVEADITFNANPLSTPWLVGASEFGLYPIDSGGDSTRSLIAVGMTVPFYTDGQTSLTLLGPAAGGTVGTSVPVLTDYVPGGVVTVAYPEPMVFVLGTRVQDSEASFGVRVFSGSPLHAVYEHPFNTFLNLPEAAAVTRVVSATDFDIALGGEYELQLWNSSGSAPIWQSGNTARALATLPATATQPTRLVAAGDYVDIRRADNGNVLWTSMATGGKKILVGNIAGSADPEFVVLQGDGSLAAFRSDPPLLLWQNTDANAADFSLGDRNGDGTLEVAVATRDGKIFWLNGNGAEIGVTATLPYPATHIAVAKVDAAPARVVTAADDYTGGELEVRSLDLTSQVASVDATTGPLDHIAIGDIDGDGDDELISLSAIPWGYSASLGQNSGLLSIRDLATGAAIWSSAIPAGLGSTSSDIMGDVAIGHVQAGAHEQIVVLGRDVSAGYVPIIDVVDGTTHAVLRRDHIDIGDGRLPTHVRLIDVDGDGIDEIVLASAPSTSVTTGVRVHVLRADTLASEWTSPILTSYWPATSVATRPSGGAGPNHLILTVAGAGFWSIDLAAHLVDYSVPADASAAASLPDATPAGRIAIIDAAGPALLVVDAATGTEVERLPLADETYHAVAAVPGDVERVVLAADDHLEAWNLTDRVREGVSPLLAKRLAYDGALPVRANGEGATFYAGNAVGIWSLPMVPVQRLIFANGFER